MKNKNKAIFAVLLTWITFSCQPEVSTSKNDLIISKLRLQLANNNGSGELNVSYQGLTESNKIAVWINKLNQVSESSIPEAHKALIEKIIQELQKSQSTTQLMDNDLIKYSAVELASITSKETYIQMFCGLADFKMPKEGIGNPSPQFLAAMKSYYSNQISTKPSMINALAGDCNCRWTCDEDGPLYTKKCNSDRKSVV